MKTINIPQANEKLPQDPLQEEVGYFRSCLRFINSINKTDMPVDQEEADQIDDMDTGVKFLEEHGVNGNRKKINAATLRRVRDGVKKGITSLLLKRGFILRPDIPERSAA